MLHLRKYGAATNVNFDLFAIDGIDFSVSAVGAAGDVKIMQDNGAEANTGSVFVDEGQGYSLALTATEMQAARIVIYLVDQTATKVWLDRSIVIETYGHASAQHSFDLDDAVRGGMTALPNAAADAAGGLPISDAGGLALDTQLAATNEITAARMGALTDWINGGRLDLLLDAIPTTPMRGTDSAALASVATEARLAELDAANLPATTDSILTDTADIQPNYATAASIAALNDPTVAAIAVAVWDALQASHVTAGSFGEIATEIASILVDTNELQTDDVPGLIAALNDLNAAGVRTALGMAAADMDTQLGAMALEATVAALNNVSTAQTLTQMNAALDTAIVELGVGVPTATPTIRTGLMFLYMGLRNKHVTDAISDEIYNDAGTIICSAVLSDDTIEYIKGEFA